MLTVQNLLEAGYRPFDDPFKRADKGYQKRVYSPWGTRYFINVYYYDYSKMEIRNLPISYAFAVDVQFQQRDGTIVNIEFTCSNMDLDFIEKKVEKLFTDLDCNDYE